jgi:hypothetical protein
MSDKQEKQRFADQIKTLASVAENLGTQRTELYKVLARITAEYKRRWPDAWEIGK